MLPIFLIVLVDVCGLGNGVVRPGLMSLVTQIAAPVLAGAFLGRGLAPSSHQRAFVEASP
jgi:hypothetical protein